MQPVMTATSPAICSDFEKFLFTMAASKIQYHYMPRLAISKAAEPVNNFEVKG
jgi:hypothetical protein